VQHTELQLEQYRKQLVTQLLDDTLVDLWMEESDSYVPNRERDEWIQVIAQYAVYSLFKSPSP